MIQTFTYEQTPSQDQKQRWVDFLHEHLGDYTDDKPDILQCIHYALTPPPHPGGLVFTLRDKGVLIGLAVLNHTGMTGYIPEHILVYLAIHTDCRGKGWGTQLMEAIQAHTHGDLALHVEPHNPAKKLYEQLGFTNKYLEMRWKRN